MKRRQPFTHLLKQPEELKTKTEGPTNNLAANTRACFAAAFEAGIGFEKKKCRGGQRKSLKRLESAKELRHLNLDIVPPDLESVPSGLDFVPKNLDFVPGDLFPSSRWRVAPSTKSLIMANSRRRLRCPRRSNKLIDAHPVHPKPAMGHDRRALV